MIRAHCNGSSLHGTARRSGGFTLIELMITMLVIAILAAIAYPIYEHQVQESRRTEARTALLELAAREQRYYATNNAYTSDPTNLGYTGQWPIVIGSGWYQIETPNVNNSPPSFTLTAKVVAGSVQSQDNTCASFTVNSDGTQTSTNSGGATNPSGTCW